MSEENQDLDDAGNPVVQETDEQKATREAAELAAKNKPPVKDDEDDRLAPIKEKLDKAFSERNDLAKKVAALEKEKRDAEIERLKEAGNHKEAFELQLKEKDQRILSLETEIVGLTRDISVKDQFRTHTFRNDKAADAAYNAVVSELVQDDKGKWVHKDGDSISAFIKRFSEDDDNQFYFAPKVNRGKGSSTTTTTTTQSDGVKLAERPQSEFLKDIAAGKFKPT